VFRRIEDFVAEWKHESASTLKLMRNLTDASLAQPIAPGGRTLGFLAWHLAQGLPRQMGQVGIEVEGPRDDTPMPTRAADIIAAYERAANSITQQVPANWTDESLTESKNWFGRQFPAGVTLSHVILHQTHHRGQMTVLMRQAGIPIVGMYGPSKEEWEAMGMPVRP
jgi:uncharacterized damage-inducible protein DinB